MLKRILYVLRSKEPNLLLNIEKTATRIYYLSKFPIKQLHYERTYFQSSKSIYNYFFHQLNLNRFFSSVPKVNEVKNLNDFIISKNGEDWESEQIEELNKMLSFLFSKGCTSNIIKEKCLPYLTSNDCSLLKFKQLEDIRPDIILLLPLLSLSLSILRLAANQARTDQSVIEGFPDRIAYLCHYLELPASELIPALVKHSALLTMKFKRLDYKMKVLKNANICSKYIVKDLWIFNYNEGLLAKRIQTALKADVELRPWMLRCTERFFMSMLMRNCETQRILGDDDMVNYLAKELRCSTEYVEYMMERNKLIKSINIPKLEQILNFLFEKGYTPQEVRLFPRVFCSSVQTLNQRFEEYQQVKSTLPTISQLCISSKNFDRILKKKSEKLTL